MARRVELVLTATHANSPGLCHSPGQVDSLGSWGIALLDPTQAKASSFRLQVPLRLHSLRGMISGGSLFPHTTRLAFQAPSRAALVFHMATSSGLIRIWLPISEALNRFTLDDSFRKTQ